MTDPFDPLRNSKDPLHMSARNHALELFRAMGRLATGKPHEDVANAACNILINSVRQHAQTWQSAESMFDEFFGRSKQMLKNHYDASGRKKGIFPYDQVVMPKLHLDKDKTH